MTALRSPARTTTADHPPGVRLVGAAIVAAMGAIVLSIAFGDFVVGSRHDLPVAIASDARSLLGTVPLIAAVGLVHLVVAAGLACGRSGVRTGARVTTGLAAVAAASVALTTAVAHVGPQAPTPTVTLALLAAAYGAATVLTGGDSAD
jgi:hypothetical protein